MFPLNDETRPAARQGLWVGFATGLYGLSFGALAVAAGLSVWQAVALSALLFSGGSQFALIGVLASGGSGVAAVAASSLLGLRNGFYGLQVARILEVRGWRRAVAAQLTIDESTAVALAQQGSARQRVGFWATGWSVYVFWNAMTLAGALLELTGKAEAGRGMRHTIQVRAARRRARRHRLGASSRRPAR